MFLVIRKWEQDTIKLFVRGSKMKSKGRLFLYVVLALSIVIGTNVFIKIDAHAAAAPPAAISQIFPDDALATEIQTTLGKSSTAEVVTQTDLDTINSLTLTSKGISSLEGMNYLTNLGTLILTGNQVSDISPLKGLTNLTMLQLSGNPISDISALSNLKNLQALDINDAQVTDITPLSGLTNLKGLGLYNNQLENLSGVNSLHQLRSLNVSNNKLTNLDELQALSNLSVLYANENQINNLQGLSNLNNLFLLDLSANQIVDTTPLAGLTKVQTLYVSNNQISDVTGLSSLINLDWLDISQNKISNIRPLNSLTKLTIIQMTNQLIVNEPISFESTVTIPNLIKNIAEQTIDPDSISDNGVYANEAVTWNLPTYIPKVSYTFIERDTIGNATGNFSGTVEQPLVQYFKATFNIDGQETTENVETGTLLQEPPTPVKEGYTFNGWYDVKQVEQNGTIQPIRCQQMI